MQHKRTCKVIPPGSDTDITMLDFTDDDFNDIDLLSTNCNQDECKKTKDRLQKRAIAANKRAAELILESIKLKQNRVRELMEMETTQMKFLIKSWRT